MPGVTSADAAVAADGSAGAARASPLLDAMLPKVNDNGYSGKQPAGRRLVVSGCARLKRRVVPRTLR